MMDDLSHAIENENERFWTHQAEAMRFVHQPTTVSASVHATIAQAHAIRWAALVALSPEYPSLSAIQKPGSQI